MIQYLHRLRDAFKILLRGLWLTEKRECIKGKEMSHGHVYWSFLYIYIKYKNLQNKVTQTATNVPDNLKVIFGNVKAWCKYLVDTLNCKPPSFNLNLMLVQVSIKGRGSKQFFELHDPLDNILAILPLFFKLYEEFLTFLLLLAKTQSYLGKYRSSWELKFDRNNPLHISWNSIKTT